jgi:hypothetical protein
VESVSTTLTVINETKIRGEALLALIAQYVPGIVGRYYGWRSIGTSDLNYPCAMVEPKSQVPTMVTTGKYQINLVYSIYIYAVDNTQEPLASLVTSMMETMVKLFSNNALGDMSNKFKSYPGYWLDSEMKSITFSPYFINAAPNTAKFMKAAVMQFEIMDVVLK